MAPYIKERVMALFYDDMSILFISDPFGVRLYTQMPMAVIRYTRVRILERAPRAEQSLATFCVVVVVYF